MATTPKKDSINPKEIQVHVPEKIRAGAYSNVANVNVTPTEVVINFLFVNPHDNPKGTLVSRVIVSREHAGQLAEILREIVSVANEVDPK